jgi:hypothetical protein
MGEKLGSGEAIVARRQVKARGTAPRRGEQSWRHGQDSLLACGSFAHRRHTARNQDLILL